MSTSQRSPRVALAAEPRLLRDAISVVLAAQGAEVVVGDATKQGVFDLAVVIDDAECERISASVYALLDTSPASKGSAQLHTADGRSLGAIDRPTELIAAIADVQDRTTTTERDPT